MRQIKNNFQKDFKERVLEIVVKIEKGSVMSYGEVAKRAGSTGRASRAVGSIMSKNSDKKVPCHRVVKSDGSIGGYNGLQSLEPGTNAKINLLKKEGVKFTKSGKVML